MTDHVIDIVIGPTPTADLTLESSSPIDLDVSTTLPGREGPEGPPGPAGPSGSGTEDDRVGDLEALSTDDKTTIVESINEVNTTMVSFRALYNNAKAG